MKLHPDTSYVVHRPHMLVDRPKKICNKLLYNSSRLSENLPAPIISKMPAKKAARAATSPVLGQKENGSSLQKSQASKKARDMGQNDSYLPEKLPRWNKE